MLKLYSIVYYYKSDPSIDHGIFVMAYNSCHAVNLLYREFDSLGKLNDIFHTKVIELDCINPAKFKNK